MDHPLGGVDDIERLPPSIRQRSFLFQKDVTQIFWFVKFEQIEFPFASENDLPVDRIHLIMGSAIVDGLITQGFLW
jgi:hypothetical protein